MKHVVLLHGWGMNGTVFDELTTSLARHFRVSAPDLPGYGDSPACEPYALENLAKEVSRYAPDRCHVVGWSLGAQLALFWAYTRPDQVECLALLGATPCFVQREDWNAAVDPAVMQAFSGALEQDSHRTLLRFLALQARGDTVERIVVRRLRDAVDARPSPAARVLAQGLRLLCESDLRAIAASVAQPALLLHGACDQIVPVAAAHQLAAMLRHARCEVLPAAAHAFFLPRAQTVAARLAEHFHGR